MEDRVGGYLDIERPVFAHGNFADDALLLEVADRIGRRTERRIPDAWRKRAEEGIFVMDPESLDDPHLLDLSRPNHRFFVGLSQVSVETKERTGLLFAGDPMIGNHGRRRTSFDEDRIEGLVRRVVVNRLACFAAFEVEPIDAVFHHRAVRVPVAAPGRLGRPDDQQSAILCRIGIAITPAGRVGAVFLDVGCEDLECLRIVGISGRDHCQLTSAVTMVEDAVDEDDASVRQLSLLPPETASVIPPEIEKARSIGIHREEGRSSRCVKPHSMVLPALEQKAPVAEHDEFRVGADIERDLFDILPVGVASVGESRVIAVVLIPIPLGSHCHMPSR